VAMLDLTNLNTEHYAYATIQRAQMLSKGVEVNLKILKS
jgi:hypothetical protein